MPRTVSIARRQLARKMAASTTKFQQTGTQWAARIGNQIYFKVMRSFRARRSFDPKIIGRELKAMQPAMAQGMLVAWLQGFIDSQKLTTLKLSIYDSAVKNLQERVDADPKALKELLGKFDTKAGLMLKDASDDVEKKLERRMTEIISKGMILKDGVKALGEEFNACGIMPGNSFQLEAIFRTQMSLAYGAGKQQAEPKDLIWGYQYVTVGDDRVRETHAEVDGVVLPAGDPFWQTCYPPNGWLCRCQVIPLLDAEEVVPPPSGYAPDDGFGFSPGELYNDIAYLPEASDNTDALPTETESPTEVVPEETNDEVVNDETERLIEEALAEAEAEIKIESEKKKASKKK
jgi:SPP1 gp7 family putative phage head morphogenesis protein